MPSFEICIACGNNSDYYVSFLLNNLQKTVTSPKDIRIILGINNYPQFDLTVLDEFRSIFEIEHFHITTDTDAGSVGHGHTLNAMLDKMTADVGMFCDCDMAFLTKGWDAVFRDCIATETAAFGLAYPNPSKYVGWPSLVACSFDVKLVKSLNIDFRPLLDPPSSEYIIKTNDEANAWGKPIGQQVILDCGYQFPLRLYQVGKQGITVPYMGTGVGVLGIGQEYHMFGKPFATHLKGSSIQNSHHPRTVQWINAVNRYIQSIGL